jgi:uncharacterized membrane protein
MHKALFLVAIAGFLFSGYMSGVKFFSGACAFNEGCPIFLGYPACYYGFAMFTLITVFSGLLLFKKWGERNALYALMIISGLGILFAGYYTLSELPLLLREGLGAYLLGLPTCAYGLIVYVSIMVLAVKARCSLKKGAVSVPEESPVVS